MTPPGARPARGALLPLLVVVCALVPYLGALDGAFVWTDHHFVEENRALATWTSVPRMFTSDAWQVGGDDRGIGYYRPARNLTFLLDTKLFGPAPAGYHFTNLILHAVCSLLVYGLVGRVFGAPGLAAWSAVLFAVHPVHVEAVAWITGRTDSCAAAGYLLALYAWLRAFGDRTRWGWWLAGCLGAAWGLLSKESAATVPAGLALCLWFRNADGDRRPGTLIGRCLPAVVLTGLYVVLRGMILTSVTNHPLWGGTLGANALTAVGLVAPYARLLAIGSPLVAVYEEHVRMALTDPAVLLGLGLMCGTVFLGLAYRRSPRAAFGAAWTAVTLLPVMQIVPFKVLMAERFLYLPSLGWCVMLAAAVSALAARAGRPARVAGLLIVGAYAGTTVRAVPVWDDDFALFEHSLRHAPHSTEAVMALARAHHDAEHAREARDLYRRATEIAPEYYLGWYNRGLTHLDLGESAEAVVAFQRATVANPDYTDAWWAYGRAAYAMDDPGTAAGAFAVVASRRPTETPYLWWARALARTGRWDEAADVFQRAVEGGAAAPALLAEGAHALLEAGRPAEAGGWLARARDADPRLAASLSAEAARAAARGEPGHARYLAGVARRAAPDDLALLLQFVRLTEADAPDDAAEALADFVAAHPDDLSAAGAHVTWLLRLGRQREAQPLAAAMAEAHPGSPVALATFAEERRAAGDLAAAARAADAATGLDPERPDLALLAGEIALDAGSPARAIAPLERARRLAPNALRAIRLLGRAYRAAGRTEDAVAVVRDGLRYAPNDPTLIALLDSLERDGA